MMIIASVILDQGGDVTGEDWLTFMANPMEGTIFVLIVTVVLTLVRMYKYFTRSSLASHTSKDVILAGEEL